MRSTAQAAADGGRRAVPGSEREQIGPRRRALNAFYGSRFPHDRVYEAEWLMGACLLVRREAAGTVGLFGEGLGQGLPLVNGALPIPAIETDFIFTAIAEELGLIGAAGLLALLGAMDPRDLTRAS